MSYITIPRPTGFVADLWAQPYQPIAAGIPSSGLSLFGVLFSFSFKLGVVVITSSRLRRLESRASRIGYPGTESRSRLIHPRIHILADPSFTSNLTCPSLSHTLTRGLTASISRVYREGCTEQLRECDRSLLFMSYYNDFIL